MLVAILKRLVARYFETVGIMNVGIMNVLWAPPENLIIINYWGLASIGKGWGEKLLVDYEPVGSNKKINYFDSDVNCLQNIFISTQSSTSYLGTVNLKLSFLFAKFPPLYPRTLIFLSISLIIRLRPQRCSLLLTMHIKLKLGT